MNWYLTVLKKYATFSGRARRKEYWMFTLINVLVSTGILALMFILTISGAGLIIPGISMLLAFYLLFMILPILAVVVRRLHDIGKSGAWFFICFIPFIGGLGLMVLMCVEGDKGANKYGPDPKSQPGFNNDALDSHLTT